jgi:hypothetical protein
MQSNLPDLDHLDQGPKLGDQGGRSTGSSGDASNVIDDLLRSFEPAGKQVD